MPDITISPLKDAEIDDVIRLARRIWHAHYPGIITVEQIDYMLERGYTPTVIRNEIEHQEIIWEVIRDTHDMIGFLSVGPFGDSTLKLHKLYLLPEHHGRGIGAMALAEVERIAHSKKAGTLILNVNRHNSKAINAYRRAGWQVDHETVLDIGNGYVMDDFVMAKKLTTKSDSNEH